MIHALDHIVLVCPALEAGMATYGALLGREADWRGAADGAGTALFRLDNMALELMAPDHVPEPGADADVQARAPVAARLRQILGNEGPGLKSVAFGTDHLEEAHRTLARRGLSPGPITASEGRDVTTGARRTWARFRCDDAAAAGLKLFVVAPGEGALEPARAGPGSVSSLDHLVIHTLNPDRALALFGARLGLRLALDRTAPEWGARFLFFRVGGLTIEIVHRLGEAGDPGAPDRLWGLTWRVVDIAAAHDRLAAGGVGVSAVRPGRKPGTRVFIARDGTLGVPTLFLEHDGPAPDA